MTRPRAGFASRALLLTLLLAALVWLGLPPTPAGPAIEWRSDLEPALADARALGRPAVLSFHAAWCSICRKLDARTLRAPEVAAELGRFVRVRLDAGAGDAASSALLERYDVQ